MTKIRHSAQRCLVVFSVILMGLSVLSPVNVAGATSLWSDTAPTSVIFGDQRARAVGDILTVVVSETSTVARSGASSNTKSASGSTDKGTGLLGFIPEMSTSQGDNFSSKGSINNTNKVTARITVKVIEVKPNGNLVISGTQNIKQNGESQTITLTGQVRPSDIQADNTIYSSSIADAKLNVAGSGPLASKQRQGILTQIWNWLF